MRLYDDHRTRTRWPKWYYIVHKDDKEAKEAKEAKISTEPR